MYTELSTKLETSGMSLYFRHHCKWSLRLHWHMKLFQNINFTLNVKVHTFMFLTCLSSHFVLTRDGLCFLCLTWSKWTLFSFRFVLWVQPTQNRYKTEFLWLFSHWHATMHRFLSQMLKRDSLKPFSNSFWRLQRVCTVLSISYFSESHSWETPRHRGRR